MGNENICALMIIADSVGALSEAELHDDAESLTVVLAAVSELIKAAESALPSIGNEPKHRRLRLAIIRAKGEQK